VGKRGACKNRKSKREAGGRVSVDSLVVNVCCFMFSRELLVLIFKRTQIFVSNSLITYVNYSLALGTNRLSETNVQVFIPNRLHPRQNLFKLFIDISSPVVGEQAPSHKVHPPSPKPQE